MVRNIKFKVSLSMERIADTNGRNIRSLCTLRYTCFNTKSWFLSRFWTKMGHPIYSQRWPDKRFKTLCSMTACTLSLSVGRFSFCISGHQILYCVGCELCGQKTAEYQYCNLTPCIQCLCKIYSNTIHNQAVNIIIKHISSILTKYSANILTWRIRGLEKLSHSGLTLFCLVIFPQGNLVKILNIHIWHLFLSLGDGHPELSVSDVGVVVLSVILSTMMEVMKVMNRGVRVILNHNRHQDHSAWLSKSQRQWRMKKRASLLFSATNFLIFCSRNH